MTGGIQKFSRKRPPGKPRAHASFPPKIAGEFLGWRFCARVPLSRARAGARVGGYLGGRFENGSKLALRFVV